MIRPAMAQIDNKEMVVHPDHYNSGGIEVFDIIRAFRLGFFDGNAVKYILRAGKKNKDTLIEDYLKAMDYLNEIITSNPDLAMTDEQRGKAEAIIKAYVGFVKGNMK